MSKNLLIVESPAKAKTIENILGKDFTVVSCKGHIRDLPKEDNAIDVNNNFIPTYVIPDDKKQVVKELTRLAKASSDVWLATDEDREGEAISWHLCEVLGLDEKKTKRIVFHEITKPAILKAVQNPRIINRNVVDAQQARRVVDRLVGFKISPILWRKIARQGVLSAGRVQSVAVRLVVEREREIEHFKVSSYYKITAQFKIKDASGKQVLLKAELPETFSQEKDARQFLEKCIGAVFTIEKIEVKPAKKSPSPPFTTSTLQQDASRKLSFSVAKTMQLAQKLYEAGKITYMRTDSTNLSDTARKEMSKQITEEYGAKYWQERQYKTKSDSAQEAHEAIRPTYFDVRTAGDTGDEKKLYDLIWKRAMASQMSDAQLERTIVDIGISTQPEKLQAKGEVIKFDGFLKLYIESALDDDDENEEEAILPPLKVGQILDLKQMLATERFRRPPARYNEASLVRNLEELGIGRPSTYAPIISTIQQRGYVVKENREGELRPFRILTLTGPAESKPNTLTAVTDKEKTGVEKAKLFPTDMGRVVNDFLLKYFENIVNYDFTANIEKAFDEIAHGHKQWNKVVGEFYYPFNETVEYTLKTAERETGERMLGEEPQTGKPVVARLGKFGPMIQIGTAEDEDKPRFASVLPPLTLNNITLEQALELFKLPKEIGQYEGKNMKVGVGKFGPYVLHNNKFYSLPKNTDPLLITQEEAITIIDAKREAEANKVIQSFENGAIQILNGRFGPYIKAGTQNVKIPKSKDPKTLTLQDCQDLIAETETKQPAANKQAKVAANAIQVLDNGNIQILEGRYGPYIKANGKNITLPKNADPKTITLEECKQLIAAALSGGKKTGKKTAKS
ncbi:type I DNA topoisomerase [Sphingobacteriales bacterium UPWRP_1]|nr:type I DNA topoisomerase [Sphingobacteriales bacterium UPWRP_1]